MRAGAPRRLCRLLRGLARGALWATCLWLAFPGGTGSAGAQSAAEVVAAEYAAPTDRYDHGILGDAVEWGALVLTVTNCADCRARERRRLRLELPESRVFEDLEPRLIRTETGRVLAMVVETDIARGARLALYDASGLFTATPYIGRTHRWLAPLGAGDLDGDGRIEVAYVDRPHLAKTLRIWRLEANRLVPVAELSGLTNHRIGWDYIPGGLRECGTGPEMILADAEWRRVMAVRLQADRLSAAAIGPYTGRAGMAQALACR